MSQLSPSFNAPLRGLVRVLPLVLGVASVAAITTGCKEDEPSGDNASEGSGGGGVDPEGSTGGRDDGMGGESVTQMGGMGGEGEGGSASGGSSDGSGGDDGTGGEDGTGGAPTCTPAPAFLQYHYNGEFLEPDGSLSTKVKELIKGHHAFVQGTSSFSLSAGPVGNAINLESDAYLQAFTPTNEDLAVVPWGVSSLEFWFNSENYSANLVSLGGLEDHMVGFGVTLFEGKPELYLKLYDSQDKRMERLAVSPNIELNDGENHHIAVSTDLNDGVLSLYVDGEYSMQIVYEGENFDVVNAIVMNSEVLEMGGSRFEETTFVGQIDEVSLYSAELDADEIADIYEAGSAGKCAD